MSEEMFEVKIDQEFKFLIPALPEKEYQQLEQNILRDGCTDPIKVWAGYDIILDGHNRYKICTERKIDYEVYPIELETREEAINWIIDNQLGRRNLTPSQESYLRGKKYNTEKKLAHRPKNGDQNDHLKTSEKIAQEEKVGPATVRRDAKFAEAVDSLTEAAGHEFSKKLISEEIKLPKSDIIKLAGKPDDEKKALIDEIQKGAKRLEQAEIELQSQKEIFAKAGAEIEFAGWSWDPKKLEAPKNTQAHLDDSEIKQRIVYLTKDIFGPDFIEEETEGILEAMRESSQWIFMVYTENLELLEKIDWPANVCSPESFDFIYPSKGHGKEE